MVGGFQIMQGFVAVSTHGDLIALSDQDDVWRPEKLERLPVPA